MDYREDRAPPKNWQDFEDLCLELWRPRLVDAKKNGRGGQPQAGVDIFGRDPATGGWVGIQCKQKGRWPARSLTVGQIESEVRRAGDFEPRLTRFILATTASRDAAIQTYIRKLSEDRQRRGHFSVDLFAWEDLQEWIQEKADHSNDGHEETVSELTNLYRFKKNLMKQGKEVSRIETKILSLRRLLRDGRSLHEDDTVCNGRFELFNEIGRGGFATVWRAYDNQRDQVVALKILHGQFSEDRTYRERFFRGSRTMRKLGHPHVASIYDEKLEDGKIFMFSMEYVPGGNLRQYVLEGKASRDERLTIIRQVGEALADAHCQKIIHRDVKPTNILIDQKLGWPKLTDFDLVWLADTTGGTRTAGALGTFIYSAPELMQQPSRVDVKVDIFSLGMTAIFCFYGRDLPLDVLRDPEAIVDQLDLPARTRTVLLRSVSWNVHVRHPTVEAFVAELVESFEAKVFLAANENNAPRHLRVPALGPLFRAFSDDLAIHVGGHECLVFSRESGIVVREDSVFALDKNKGRVVAVGNSAAEMSYDASRNIELIHASRDGVSLSETVMGEVLRILIRKAHGGRRFVRPGLALPVNPNIGKIEARQLVSCAMFAGATEVFLVDAMLAELVGVGLPLKYDSPQFLLTINQDFSAFSACSGWAHQRYREVPISTSVLNDSIKRFLKERENLLVSDRTAARIRVELGCALPSKQNLQLGVGGRHLVGERPFQFEVDSNMVHEALREDLEVIDAGLNDFLHGLSADFSDVIIWTGLVLSGDGVLLRDMDQRLRGVGGIPTVMADDPTSAMILGLGRLLSHSDVMKMATITP